MKKIDDETLDYVEILAKLDLSEDERIKAKDDMEKMLAFIEKMNELDTKDVVPLSHVTDINNVFREDEEVSSFEAETILSNAPNNENNMYEVPCTILSE